jgi:Putative adhesin
MEVNYTVYLPATTTLKLYNEFGNTTLGNYEGMLELHNKFGNVKAEELTASASEILVEFGNADIKSISKPDLTVKFGNCDLANVIGNGEMKFEFCGDVNISIDKNIGDVKIKNSYSNIELTANENTNATFAIKSSYGDVKNKSKFIVMKSDDDDDKDDDRGCCDFTKNYEAKIGNGTSKININNSYGKIKFR